MKSDTSRPVRLFRNGRNQAVRIPREFELPGNDAILSKEGDALIIRPAQPRSLLEVLKGLRPIRDTLSEPEDRLPEPVDL